MGNVILVIAIAALLGFVLMRRSSGRGGSRKTIRPKSNARVRPYELTLPPIPADLKPCSVESHSVEGRTYEVDLSNVVCTCKDFQARESYPQESLARCCKHLIRQLGKSKIAAVSGKWEQAIIAERHGSPRGAWLVKLDSAPEVLITASSSQEWTNVFAHSKRKGEKISEATGIIHRHGWSVKENRWSYGEGPAGARELTPLMRELF